MRQRIACNYRFPIHSASQKAIKLKEEAPGRFCLYSNLQLFSSKWLLLQLLIFCNGSLGIGLALNTIFHLKGLTFCKCISNIPCWIFIIALGLYFYPVSFQNSNLGDGTHKNQDRYLNLTHKINFKTASDFSSLFYFSQPLQAIHAFKRYASWLTKRPL